MDSETSDLSRKRPSENTEENAAKRNKPENVPQIQMNITQVPLRKVDNTNILPHNVQICQYPPFHSETDPQLAKEKEMNFKIKCKDGTLYVPKSVGIYFFQNKEPVFEYLNVENARIFVDIILGRFPKTKVTVHGLSREILFMFYEQSCYLHTSINISYFKFLILKLPYSIELYNFVLKHKLLTKEEFVNKYIAEIKTEKMIVKTPKFDSDEEFWILVISKLDAIENWILCFSVTNLTIDLMKKYLSKCTTPPKCDKFYTILNKNSDQKQILYYKWCMAGWEEGPEAQKKLLEEF